MYSASLPCVAWLSRSFLNSLPQHFRLRIQGLRYPGQRCGVSDVRTSDYLTAFIELYIHITTMNNPKTSFAIINNGQPRLELFSHKPSAHSLLAFMQSVTCFFGDLSWQATCSEEESNRRRSPPTFYIQTAQQLKPAQCRQTNPQTSAPPPFVVSHVLFRLLAHFFLAGTTDVFVTRSWIEISHHWKGFYISCCQCSQPLYAQT